MSWLLAATGEFIYHYGVDAAGRIDDQTGMFAWADIVGLNTDNV